MRRLRKQQDRCQMALAEKSNNFRRKSHGFAFSRTVSCKSNTDDAEEIRILNLCYLCTLLTADGDAQGADVAARIKRAQRDGVLARAK